MPLPRDETTPPVTNTYLVMYALPEMEIVAMIRPRPKCGDGVCATGNLTLPRPPLPATAATFP